MSVAIVPYEDFHQEAFYRLNRAWLDEHGLFEPHDEEQLSAPIDAFVEPGGEVYVALDGEVVVGTAAILPWAAGGMEIAKLTVTESARGRGIGRLLAETCIRVARARGAEKVVLISSSLLQDAVRLYERIGFVHRPLPHPLPYETADVYMELSLTSK